MRDWNKNGKRDGYDRMVDYMIYKEITKESENKPEKYYGGSSSGCGEDVVFLGVLFLILGVILLLGLMFA